MEGFVVFLVIFVLMPIVTGFMLKRRWGLRGSMSQYPFGTRLKVVYSAMLWPITLTVLILTNQRAARNQQAQQNKLDELLSAPEQPAAAGESDIPYGSTPPNQPKPKNPFDD